MPTVVAMLKAERARGGGDLINECWKRGVVEQEPGWFFAQEAGVSVGVPSTEFLQDPHQAAIAAMFPKRAVLMLRGAMVAPAEVEPEPSGPNAKQRAAREIVNGTH